MTLCVNVSIISHLFHIIPHNGIIWHYHDISLLSPYSLYDNISSYSFICYYMSLLLHMSLYAIIWWCHSVSLCVIICCCAGCEVSGTVRWAGCCLSSFVTICHYISIYPIICPYVIICHYISLYSMCHNVVIITKL
jgi:hypothetical protein